MQRLAQQEIRLIAVPFHDGLERVDRGLGPIRLLDAVNASGAMRDRPVSVETIPAVEPALPEAARVFELNRRLARRVRATMADDVFPVVLAGDCNSCLGTVAGCGPQGLGVVWFDAHADFDSPEDSHSGSLDGMGLAMLTGRGWRALRETIPGLHPIGEDDVLLIGVRDLEPTQREQLRRSRIRRLEGNSFTAADLRVLLDELRGRVERVYLHIDLDALDPREGRANEYSAPAGLSSEQLLTAAAEVFGRFHVTATAITAYDPACDVDGRMATTATRLIDAIAGLPWSSRK